MTPMQEPANIPLDVICHEREMKHASMVYQFQSIEILQLEPPLIDIAASVELAAADIVVAVGSVLPIYIPEWSIFKLV